MKINQICLQIKSGLVMLLFCLPLPLFADFKEVTLEECNGRNNFNERNNLLVLDLDTAIRMAITNGDKLFYAQNAIRNAELLKEVSESEFYLNINPKCDSGYIGGGTAGSGITLGGGIDFEKKLPIGTLISINPSLLKAADKYHSNFQARISQPLLRRFGREYNLSGIRIAEFSQRTATRMFHKTMSYTVLRSIELLYEVAKQEQLVALNTDAYARQAMFLKATKVKERIGLSNGLDVYLAEVELKQAEDALNQADENLQNSKDLLRDLLGLSQDAKFVIRVPLDLSTEEWNLKEAVQTALINRIEIDQGKDQMDESRRLAKLSKNDLLPDLNFVMDYSNMGYGEEFTGSFGRERESRWGIGLTTSTDSNRTREKSAYERTLMGIEGAKKAFSDIKKSIVLEVKQTLRAIYRSREKIALQRQQIKNLEGGLQLAKAKFLREFATSLELIQAEKAFHSSQINLICSLIDHQVGEYRLRAVLGLLIEK